MTPSLALVASIIPVVLAIDDSNDFHDAANSIATVVSTRVPTSMQAVACAAFSIPLSAAIAAMAWLVLPRG
jgi:phosphate/sulfate permease